VLVAEVAVLGVLLPIAFRLSKASFYRAWGARAASVVVALVGLYLLVRRITG
jgi:hypothetical protein